MREPSILSPDGMRAGAALTGLAAVPFHVYWSIGLFCIWRHLEHPPIPSFEHLADGLSVVFGMSAMGLASRSSNPETER